MEIWIDLHIFSGRFFLFWLHKSFSRGPHATRPHMTLSAARISWIDPCISCHVGHGLCCLYGGRQCFESWFGSEHCCSSLATMKGPPPPPPVTALLRTSVTYRLTFMAQHALLDFLGQDQVARLRSGPLENYNSPCVWSWAWRGEQHKCALFCHRVNKIELNCALCFWKLPRVNTCAAPIAQRCEMHTLHSEPQNNLEDIAKQKSCC